MNKKINVVLYAICCILALYGLIILIRKIMLAPEAVRKTKKDLGMKFFIEPYQYKGWFDLEDPNIIKERNTKCLQNKFKVCSSKRDNLTYDQCMNLSNDSFLGRYQNECKSIKNNIQDDFLVTDLPDLSNMINL